MPTREEIRSMTWQAVAAGANGIIYYYFADAYRRGTTKEESARRWADVCAVAREMKEKEPTLLSEPGPAISHDSCADFDLPSEARWEFACRAVRSDHTLSVYLE